MIHGSASEPEAPAEFMPLYLVSSYYVPDFALMNNIDIPLPSRN